MSSDQSRIIEQARSTYFPLAKNNWRIRKKQVEALEVLKTFAKNLSIKDAIPENTLSEKAKNEPNKIKEIEKNGG